MRVQRWISLTPQVDEKVIADSKKEDRSIAKILQRIINKHYDKEAQ